MEWGNVVLINGVEIVGNVGSAGIVGIVNSGGVGNEETRERGYFG